MKQLIYAVMSLLLLISCNRDDGGTVNPVDQLPPLTTEGKNTFGCLINGEVFLPNGGGIGGSRSASYQFVNGEYYLNIWGSGETSTTATSIGIKTRGVQIDQRSYQLYNQRDSYLKGTYYYQFNVTDETYAESSTIGKLIITKFDEQNRIVSGTFWFDAEDENGDKIEIRDGRFDMKFTI